MKQEILKIIEMNKKGTISDEQMTELLEALVETHTEKNRSAILKKVDTASTSEEITGLIDNFTAGPITPEIDKKKKIKDIDKNKIAMSNFIMPEGDDFTFKDNNIKLSNFYGTEFEDSAEFIDNSIQGSHIARLKMKGGTVNGCSFSRCNLDSINIREATLRGSNFNRGKILNLEISNGSNICDVKFHRMSVKGMRLEESTLFQDIKFHRLALVNVNFAKTEIINLVFDRAVFTNLTFKNVKLKDCKFHRCSFKNSEISNVDLQDYKLSNINFSNQKIDGNDAFYSFTGGSTISNNNVSSDATD